VLTTAGIAALNSDQIKAIETADIQALKTSQIAAITTSTISALTTDQVFALSSSQVCAITSAQYGAITTDQISHLTSGTPLILDLNGDGVSTLSIKSGVRFDLFADGKAVQTGWVSNSDGLLVLDRNHDGQINDGSELFGSSTTLADGTKAADGYAALAELDSIKDGVISQADAGFADLRVWVDANSDGISAAGELKSLTSLGIASINLNAQKDTATDNGNIIGLTSTYQTTDGATHAAADVWFVADKSGTMADVSTINAQQLDQAIAALATDHFAQGAPEAVQLPITDSAANGMAVANEVVAPVDNLRTKVSSLAQALGAFDGGGSAEAVSQHVARLDPATAPVALASPVTQAVSNMADVLKRFDANGNPLGNAGALAMPLIKSTNLPGIPDASASGFLASGGK
jgi:hypothetical protein